MRNLNSVETNAVVGGEIIYYGDLLFKNGTIIGRLEFLNETVIDKKEQKEVYNLFKETFLNRTTKGKVGSDYDFKLHIYDKDEL